MTFKDWTNKQALANWKKCLWAEVQNEAVEEGFIVILIINFVIVLVVR